MTSRVMIVLGGNAFVKPDEQLTMAGQFKFAQSVMMQLEPLLAEPAQVVVTHGNGPQVGHILTRVEEALGKAYAIPLEVCVAESQGELGYVLEQSLYNVLRSRGHTRPIASLLTQVVVDRDDPAFMNPTKPIGPYYSRVQADALSKQGFSIHEDSGRGFRRVVADTFLKFPHLTQVLPALGYSSHQREELAKTINASGADAVVDASPAGLSRFLNLSVPVVRVRYQFQQVSGTPIEEIVRMALAEKADNGTSS